MVRRKTMKKRAKKLRTRSMRSRTMRGRTMRGRTMRGRRKIKNTKRKMRGGEGEHHDHYVHMKTMLETCLTACNALQPFIQHVYDLLNYDNLTENKQNELKLKEDYERLKETGERIDKNKISEIDIFTIADGMVQYILRKYLFKDYKNFVGEEQVEVNEPRSSQNQSDQYVLIEKNIPSNIPDIFTTLIDEAIRSIGVLKIPSETLNKFTIFLDPIDGTAEFKGAQKGAPPPIGGKGDQCTILIGFADEKENAVAGLAYRPVINPYNTKNTYVYGWVDGNGKGHVNDNNYQAHLNMSDVESDPTKIRFITSNGAISEITSELIDQIGGERIPSGGAGNKILMLLENKGDVYLQDRGVSRWDTCAGEAILRAQGGLLCKLTDFDETGGSKSRYTYRPTTNDIFGVDNPNNNVDENTAAKYIEQNSVIPENLVAKFKDIKNNKKQLSEFFKANSGDKPEQIHHTATNNLCGLVAITKDKIDLLPQIKEAIDNIKKENETMNFSYD
jgi:3'-phosphoadenosine 5'-phosphosulfate (PAPS) 3'-phosphatase